MPDGSRSACMRPTLGRGSRFQYRPKGVLGPGVGVAADEGGLVAPLVRRAQLRLLECADPEEELELVPEVGVHHLGTVRCDRELHAVLDERAEDLAHRVLAAERL